MTESVKSYIESQMKTGLEDKTKEELVAILRNYLSVASDAPMATYGMDVSAAREWMDCYHRWKQQLFDCDKKSSVCWVKLANLMEDAREMYRFAETIRREFPELGSTNGDGHKVEMSVTSPDGMNKVISLDEFIYLFTACLDGFESPNAR